MNTKSDIGACPFRYHEDSLKEQYEQRGEAFREQYERELLMLLESLISDAERKMRRGRERLEMRPNDPSVTHALGTSDEAEERRVLLDLQIKELVVQIEACAEEGKFDQVQELTERLDSMKAEINSLKMSIDYDNPLHRLEKRMEVCSTCGALLVINDAPKRVDAHFEGRQHLSWVELRNQAEILRQKGYNVRTRRPRDAREMRDSRDSRDYRDSRDSRESRDSRDSRDYRDSRDSRDNRDSHSREVRRDYRDSREYSRDRDYGRDSRDSREREREREYRSRDSRDGRDRDYRSGDRSYESRSSRRYSDDKESYVPGGGLDYELGELPEDGEIPVQSRRSRSRSRSRERSRH